MNNTSDKAEEGLSKDGQSSQQTSAEGDVLPTTQTEKGEKPVDAESELVSLKNDDIKPANKDGITSTSTDSSSKDSSIETITVLSGVSALDSPSEKQPVAQNTVHITDDQQKASALKTKEKGDLVVVGNSSSSARTSPSSSESNSHNKGTCCCLSNSFCKSASILSPLCIITVKTHTHIFLFFMKLISANNTEQLPHKNT